MIAIVSAILLAVASVAVDRGAFVELARGWTPSPRGEAISVDAVFGGKDGGDVVPVTCAAVATIAPTAIAGRDYPSFTRLRGECAAACAIGGATAASFDRRQLVATARAIPLAALPRMLTLGGSRPATATTLGMRARLRAVGGRVEARLAGESLVLTPLAFADFDRDGRGDVLLRADYALSGGSYTAIDLVAMSPQRGRRAARIAWRWDGSVCGVASPARDGAV